MPAPRRHLGEDFLARKFGRKGRGRKNGRGRKLKRVQGAGVREQRLRDQTPGSMDQLKHQAQGA
jgi:hypothetical protein